MYEPSIVYKLIGQRDRRETVSHSIKKYNGSGCRNRMSTLLSPGLSSITERVFSVFRSLTFWVQGTKVRTLKRVTRHDGRFVGEYLPVYPRSSNRHGFLWEGTGLRTSTSGNVVMVGLGYHVLFPLDSSVHPVRDYAEFRTEVSG